MNWKRGGSPTPSRKPQKSTRIWRADACPGGKTVGMARVLVLLVALAALGGVALSGCGSEEPLAKPTSTDPLVTQGYALATSRGCGACHTSTGKDGSAPTFKGLYGSTVTLDNGTTATVDDAYLHRALTDPNADVRQGYRKNVMSAFLSGQKQLTPEQIDQLVAYIKSAS